MARGIGEAPDRCRTCAPIDVAIDGESRSIDVAIDRWCVARLSKGIAASIASCGSMARDLARWQSRARDGVDGVDGVGVRGGATTRWDGVVVVVVDGVDGVDGVEARRGVDSDAHASRGARRWRATVVVVVVVVEATETANGGGGVRWRDDERVRAQWRVVVRA